MSKKPKKPNRRKLSGNDFRRLRRQIEGIYFLRLSDGSDPGKLQIHHRTTRDQERIDAMLFQLSRTPIYWQCVTVSYFEDPFGKRYRGWGFAKANHPLRTFKEPLDPILLAAQKHSEENANLKHLYARGYVLAPWSKQYPDLTDLVKKHKDELNLSDGDLVQLEESRNDQLEYYEFNPEENHYPEEELTLEERIAQALPEN